MHIHCNVAIIHNILSLTDDHNCIVLNAIPGFDDCQGEFINACYIEVSKIRIKKLNN